MLLKHKFFHYIFGHFSSKIFQNFEAATDIAHIAFVYILFPFIEINISFIFCVAPVDHFL